MPVYACTLWKYLTARDAASFRLEERLELALKVSKEVRLLNEKHLVHRDLKPSNIMLDRGNTVLVDFGIGNDYLTKGSRGTVGFNAPESFACSQQNRQSDWFSLGKVLVLILFEWKVGWKLIWSPSVWTERETRSKFGRLDDIRELIVEMLKV